MYQGARFPGELDGGVRTPPAPPPWYEKLGFRLTDTRTFDHLPFEVAFMATEL